jgi:monoamine oxidase
VSPGVLAAGSIALDPRPDPALLTALASFEMGQQMRIALRFDAGSPVLRYPENARLLAEQTPDRAHHFQVRPSGLPLVICVAGGVLARDLGGRPERYRVDVARGLLRDMLGTSADKGFRAGVASDWGNNPLFLGAHACALPGAISARDVLRTPIATRIFLAGEALAGKAIQTVHGAYESGRSTAGRVLAVLRRS